MSCHPHVGSAPRLLAIVATMIAAGCSSTPTSEEILARAAELNRRAANAATQNEQPNTSASTTPEAAKAPELPASRTRNIVSQPMPAPGVEQTAMAPQAGTKMSSGAETRAAADAAADGRAPASEGDDLMPPDAKPGECYAKVFIEPTYRSVTENLIVREATTRLDTVPARFEQVTERVLVKPADIRYELVPAKFEWVEERVLVTPESTRLVTVPAVTKQVQEKVLVKAAYTTWRKGKGPIQKIDATTGEIMCLVEVPAIYDTVTKTVEVTPEQVREEIVPAVYRTVRKQVMVQPAQARPIEVPAEFKTVQVNRLAEPAREIRVAIPAQTSAVERRELVSPGRVEWREILCETNMTRDRVRAIQRALADAGYDPGPVDGVIAKRTMAAVNAYQRANDLPVDAYLNMQTVRALGVMR
ncbi:MAG: peptidoglycan-binding domain-containing protein [Burkholderiaceae bacterium]